MTKRFSLIVPGAFFLGVIMYFGYQLFLVPRIVKLSAPEKIPFFSVDYIYGVKSTSLISFSFGSEQVAASDLGSAIKKDIQGIKTAGFDGIKLSFNFKGNNYYSDRIALKAAEAGLYPIGIFTGHGVKPKDRAFNKEEIADWEAFVKSEVKKNKNIIYFWEVWNEPAMTELRFRYGTPAEYLELLKRTEKIIREENPLAKIIVTIDYTDTQAEAFTSEFLKLGGADYLDYLSFHPYNAIDPKARFNLVETVAQEKALAKKYNKPLLISEIGTPDSDSNEVRQAELALKLFQTALENKIPIVWFHWSDRRLALIDGKTGWGIVRVDNTFKPSYDKIKAFIAETKQGL
jgi:hypothetical protein